MILTMEISISPPLPYADHRLLQNVKPTPLRMAPRNTLREQSFISYVPHPVNHSFRGQQIFRV